MSCRFRKSLGDIERKLEEIQQLQPELVERSHQILGETQTALVMLSLRVLSLVEIWVSLLAPETLP